MGFNLPALQKQISEALPLDANPMSLLSEFADGSKIA